MCAMWIVKRKRYRPSDQPTDTASIRRALAHVKMQSKKDWKVNNFSNAATKTSSSREDEPHARPPRTRVHKLVSPL